MIDIAGLDRASVIQALYAASRPQGMGFLHYQPGGLDRAEAERLVGCYIDYLNGRVMKVQIGPADTFEEWHYDLDNGPRAASRVIDAMRSGDVAETARAIHEKGVSDASAIVRENLGKPDEWVMRPGIAELHLGLPDDVGLAEAVERAQPKSREKAGS